MSRYTVNLLCRNIKGKRKEKFKISSSKGAERCSYHLIFKQCNNALTINTTLVSLAYFCEEQNECLF